MYSVDSYTLISTIAFKQLENPFLLFNPSGLCVAAQGSLPDDFDCPEWFKAADGVRSGLTIPGFKLDSRTVKERHPVVFRKVGRYSLLVTNIFVGDARFGQIVYCDANRPFTRGFLSLATYFCSFMEGLSRLSLKFGKIGEGETSFFVEALSNPRIDETWLQQHSKALGLSRGQKYRMVVMQGSEDATSSEEAYNLARLKRAFPREYVFAYEHHVIAFLSGKTCPLDEEALRGKLSEAFGSEAARFGASMPFYDIRDLKGAYRQCKGALALGAKQPAGKRAKASLATYTSTNFFDDFIKFYKIDLDHRWTMHPKVKLLCLYDQAHNMDNVKYLLAYLDCGCSVKNASAALNVHGNTLAYRLARIREIADLDLREPMEQGEMFHIFLSCMLVNAQGESS